MDAPTDNFQSTRSLGSSLSYLPFDPSTFESEATSPLLQEPEVSITTLRACRVAFQILSNLKDGDLLEVAANNELKKYPRPEWTLLRLWRTVSHFFKPQNSEHGLLIIETIAKNTLKCVTNPSKLVTTFAFGEAIFELHKLDKHVNRVIKETYAIFLKTCFAGDSDIPTTILEARNKRVRELKNQLEQLNAAIKRCIAQMEQPLFERHKEQCDRCFGMIYSRDTLRGDPGLDLERVLNSAAHAFFTAHFDTSLVNAVYQQYRLERPGLLRLQDFHALTIGLLAQMRALDVSQEMLRNLGDRKPPFNALRNATTSGITTVLERYRAVFERDVALLSAHQSLDNYSKGNSFINGMFRFAFIEREMLDLALPFTRYPECPLVEGTVFECIEGSYYKSYQLLPLRQAGRVYAVGLVPLNQTVVSNLRILITGSNQTSLDLYSFKESLQQIVHKSLATSVSLDRSISLEICIPSMAANQSTVLTCLFNSLKDLVDVGFTNVNLYFWGPLAITEEASYALQLFRAKFNMAKFHLRYFLFRNQTFTYPAVPQFKQPLQNGAHSNFCVSLFYLQRDRDSVNASRARARRYFSQLDENKLPNETYLGELVTNDHEDARLTLGTGNNKKLCTRVHNFDAIVNLLNPPPPPPGILDSAYRSLGAAYSMAGNNVSYYLGGYFNGK